MAKQPAPNQKKMAIVLSAVLVAITLLTGVLALLQGNPYGKASGSSPVETVLPERGESSSSQGEPTPDSSMSGPDSPSLPEGETDIPSESETSDESEPSEQPQEPEEPVYFNVPEEMRAVQITAGRDYLTGEDRSRAAVAAQIDQALQHAQELTMNSIIIDTKWEGSVLFTSSALQMAQTELDCVDYLAAQAREMGFFVYATYDVSDLADADGNFLRGFSADGETLDSIRFSIGEFAGKYQFDGILLQNYDAPSGAERYASYLQSGGGIGYQNYLRQIPEAMVLAAADAIRQAAPGTQVGLMVDAVWENQSVNPDGSETAADATSLGTGNADTRKFVESGQFDFVMVRNFDSTTDPKAEFRTVARWWKGVAEGAGVTLYTMHANERLGVEPYGWQVMEQLTKQVIDLRDIGVGSGSAFRSLKALADNPGGTTTMLVQYMNNEIDETYVLQQLSISKPAELVYKTREPTVTFQGASDPREKVTINGEEIPRNESGYFTVRKDLAEGLNTFAISHKNKTFTYQITREVIVLKDIQPTGAISVDGGMAVTVTALAYEGSSVTASLGGQQITLTETEFEGDDTDRDSGYRTYTGVFTMPSASESATKLGAISVTAVMSDGHSMTLEGASVTVNKKAKMGDGVVVQVVADQAETFPISSLDDSSHSGYYPLPRGTVDRTYGSEIIYKNGNTTKSYWKLQSGVRVYSKDITTGGQMPDNNKISGMSIKSSGGYTTVSLTTGSKIPYTVAYDGNRIVFKFAYTASVPESRTLGSDNALFTSAEWSGSDLTLNLKKPGGFIGYRAYYEEETRLVLRFNNSPGSLSGARIVVDPGHGGNDPGALGFYPDKDEADINLEIAQRLADELKSQGASVLMVTPGSTMASRLESARAFNPQVLVSVHNNTNWNPEAKGSEVYYFYPFQKQLAALISANVSAALDTVNRGAKSGLYYMTRESQFACVLIETGFISNESEYSKLINSKYQNRIAQGIASGISSYLGGAWSGGGTGSGDDEDQPDAPVEVTGVSLDTSQLNLEVGGTAALEAAVEPAEAENQKVVWESADAGIASVDQSGTVTAVSEGKTTVRVTTEEGGYTAECEVEVSGASGSAPAAG